MMDPRRETDVRYMARALALARKGAGKVAPNPMVGCVVVKDDRIVGEGFHRYFGGPHAEIVALTQAGPLAEGSTLYVTLEPCDHFGKTPPCTGAIIAAGVARVVAAMPDPNPVVRGRGVSRLRRNSIRVSMGLLGAESRWLNRTYLRSWIKNYGRVIAKAGMTLDGKIATAAGESKWITSKAARTLAHRTRASVDAVVVGRKTVQRDNPGLTSHGTGPNPVRVVVDPDLRIPLHSRVFSREAPTIVLHCVKGRSRKLESVRRKGALAVYFPARRGGIQFRKIIQKLRGFGIRRILIEGGGETLAAAFEAGVVTDVMFFVAPRILGGRTAKTPVEGAGPRALADAWRLRGMKARRIGPDILLTASVDAQKKTRRG